MSLDTNLRNFATKVSTDTKQLRTFINGNVADLSALTTTAKTTLVAAINEVNAKTAAIINDAAATSSTTQTYSASKIVSVANAAAAQAKADILGGVGAAYDTLQELLTQIQSDEGVVTGLMTAVGNRLRIDVNNQGLTTTQQLNGRTNLEVYGTGDIGPVTTDYVALYNAGQA